MRLVLFDIDMTLIDPAGAGREGMERAFEELFGVTSAFEHVAFAGQTDRHILLEALERQGMIVDATVRGHDLELPFDRLVPLFVDVYARHLADTLAARRGRALPGAAELVRLLHEAPVTGIGLATGNFRRGAMLKLARYGMGEHLREGGFGDDHLDRRSLVLDAVERLDGAIAPACVVVVGDTPFDVQAAKWFGGAAVGVATGYHTSADLRAAGADIVFDDFGDAERVADAVLGLTG